MKNITLKTYSANDEGKQLQMFSRVHWYHFWKSRLMGLRYHNITHLMGAKWLAVHLYKYDTDHILGVFLMCTFNFI